jgi:hypothetical protein
MKHNGKLCKDCRLSFLDQGRYGQSPEAHVGTDKCHACLNCNGYNTAMGVVDCAVRGKIDGPRPQSPNWFCNWYGYTMEPATTANQCSTRNLYNPDGELIIGGVTHEDIVDYFKEEYGE